ncbi:hypothetical protein D3C73_1033370 [compost metagenome]
MIIDQRHIGVHRFALRLKRRDLFRELSYLFLQLRLLAAPRHLAGKLEHDLRLGQQGTPVGRHEGEFGWKINACAPRLFCKKTRFLHHELRKLAFDDAEIGASGRPIEAEKQRAGLDAISLVDDYFRDDTAIGMFDLLGATENDDLAGGHHGAADFGIGRSGVHASEEKPSDTDCQEQLLADGTGDGFVECVIAHWRPPFRAAASC